MSEPTYVTVVAKMTLPVHGAETGQDAERRALAHARQSYPMLPWTVEHVERPWGT